LLIDLHQDSPQRRLKADVIIIGAGAVGLAMGVEMARSGSQILLLEAGGSWVTAESQAFFESARAIGRQLNGLHLGRFRALGGTTTFWGGQLAALDPLTYGCRPWVADTEWPIRHPDVAPYYARLFSLLGMSRQIPDDSEVWRRLRVSPPEDTTDLEFFFTRWAPEANFARLFANDIHRSPNLTVAINAPVTALQLDPNGGRVLHLEVRANDGDPIQAHAENFVMANGAIETPRLLLLNLADGKVAPWARNPWIGRGFMDHLECIAGTVTPMDKRRFHNLFDNVYLDGIKYQPKIKLSEQGQVSRKLLSVAAHLQFRSSISEHISNARIFFKAAVRGKFDFLNILKYPAHIVSLARFSMPIISRYIRDHRVYNVADRGIDLSLSMEQKPLASSAIVLRQDSDAIGMARIDVDWRVDGAELETLASFAELLRDYLELKQLARLQIVPALANRDPAFMSTAHDTSHHMGTTRMASDAHSGVVDGNLKVHGTDNLFVAGAGVYPTSGFQNPTFTAMALGIRLADALRAKAR
jgi:choline dehydrogenase-like flavoprotein